MTSRRRSVGRGLDVGSFGLATVVLVGMLALLPAQTRAQDAQDATSQQARDLYRQGDRAYREGRYEEAVEAFQQAYELSGRPQLLYNMANAYERLNRLTDAVAALEQYAPEAPEGDRTVIQSRITQLEARIATERDAAEHASAEHDAHQDASPPSSGTSSQRGHDLTGPAVLMSIGGAAIVASIVMGVLALSDSNAARSACMVVGGRTICPESAHGNSDAARNLALATDISWGVGATAAAIGLVWLIVDLSSGSSSSETAPHASVSVGPDYSGVVVTGSF